MNELVITDVMECGALPEGKGGYIDLQTNEGRRQIRFTYEDADRLILAAQRARDAVQAKREHSEEEPLAQPSKVPQKWETSIDPINPVAILRARFPDRPMQEADIARSQIPEVTAFLQDALGRFEATADSRQ